MINRRQYGNSGLSLPVLGIGCWAYGGGDYWGPQDQTDVKEVVAQALDLGVNYFDTAEGYNEGRSEEALGQALKGRRHEAIIGTKVPPEFTEATLLREHCEASLKRLQTDTIDIYMIHWPLIDQPADEVFATMAALQAEGKIRDIGVSNFGVNQLTEARSTGARIAVNQLCYNLMSRAIEFELMATCRHGGVGILAYSPLLQGVLTGKFHSADEMPPSRTRTRHFKPDRPGSRHGEPGVEHAMFAALAEIGEIAAELGAPMAQVALAWTMARDEITCVLPGIRTKRQLEENVAGAQLNLPAEAKARLDAITRPIRDQLGDNPDYYQSQKNSRIS